MGKLAHKRNRLYWLSKFRNPLVVFLLKGFILFLFWDLVVYDHLITPVMHNWVIYKLIDLSAMVLRWFYPQAVAINTELYINTIQHVHVGIPCNGVQVMGVFACIVLAFNTRWYHKCWMIISCCVIVFVLNVARVTALSALLNEQCKQTFDINHKYIFNIVLYTILLVFFSLWSSKFGVKVKNRPIS